MSSLTVEAIYEDGMLRLSRPIDIANGSRVEVVVTSNPAGGPPSAAQPTHHKRTPAELIAEIAAMPMESSPDGFSGRDHDKILYGGPDGAQ